jgi:hypothetical protein
MCLRLLLLRLLRMLLLRRLLISSFALCRPARMAARHLSRNVPCSYNWRGGLVTRPIIAT